MNDNKRTLLDAHIVGERGDLLLEVALQVGQGETIAIMGPNGAGKTSLARALVKDNKNLSFSVSVTTRKPRPGEKDGREYHFVTNETFEMKKKHNEFLEWAEVFGKLYGTPIGPINDLLEEGKDLIFDVDWQGSQQIKNSS